MGYAGILNPATYIQKNNKNKKQNIKNHCETNLNKKLLTTNAHPTNGIIGALNSKSYQLKPDLNNFITGIDSELIKIILCTEGRIYFEQLKFIL